ncbi:translation initiation factor eIF2B delta subunit [Cordyceps militaris CM01]|uniref:Translation initiation factor eIF2B subunit delta n=1 Tax=Cordyceps militaris (strain CM01) TaxID=983644 RepID=G3J8W5_CORMM|nr:translation initiation factor eIF2B delta subunit [Cordyceps militaris CM01]EGX94848.1 translation initiation factor eIF2B delta subunit [Cordyceps militaris CM01]
MSTEGEKPAAGAGDTSGGPTQPPPSGETKSSSKDAPATGAAPAGDKKLSGAELKKKAKEEKAARRMQAKVMQTAAAPPGAAAAAAAAAAAKGKAKQDGGAGASAHGSKTAPRTAPTEPPKPKATVPACFSHLSMAKRMSITQADKDVHPVMLQLGQKMSTFAISDSITRAEATLLAFKQVIESYTTPHGATLSRHLTSVVLKNQIEYLTACRPMCFSMGNAIRWLKLQISKVDIDLPDADAKKQLGEAIDAYLHERVTLADIVIVKTAADMLTDDDVVVTYARHRLVERALLRARADGKRFRVVLVDDPFERVGLTHAKRLSAAGVPVAYSHDLGALRTNLQGATCVLIAAEAMFSNGAVYARAGTCDIATVARDLQLRVVALCESINFTERVSADSLTYNEIDPERNSSEAFRLLFDTTTDKFISMVVTELGNSSAKSVPAILRKLEEL